jgi:4-carboxymuconolactone decarboxylase
MELPEFDALFLNEEQEIHREQKVPEKERALAILALLISASASKALSQKLPEFIASGALSRLQTAEVFYQAIPYLGYGKAKEMSLVLCDYLAAENLHMVATEPLNEEERLSQGSAAQVAIFGEGMKDFYKGSDVNRYLALNCFGDFYTRRGLDLPQRELVTFCFLYGLGGCEPQVLAHIHGNLHCGNSLAYLRGIVKEGIPYIGYPRSLNALTALATVEKEGH